MTLLIAYFKKRVNFFTPFLLFLITFFTYLHNLSASVYGGDVGDLVAAAVVRGVPHPSGYPLFTMLGILFNALPIHQTPAWKIGLISVLSSSFSLVLFYLIVVEISQLRQGFGGQAKQRLAAFIGALTLAFIYPFWLYSELAEVFALNNFFILLLFYLAIIYNKKKKNTFLYIFSFILGLSLSHHQIILLVLPSFLPLILFKNFKILKKPYIILKCVLLLILGFFPYAYIPLAASRNPPINWDQASNLSNFIHLLFRKDYGYIKGQETLNIATRISSLNTFLKYFFIEFPFIFILLSFIGALFLFIKEKKVLFLSIFIMIFLTGPFYTAYAAVSATSQFQLGVLERFYVLSVFPLAILCSVGIIFLAEIIPHLLKMINPIFSKRTYPKYLILLIFSLIPLSFFIKNFPKTDLHNVWIGDNVAYDILSPLPPNSILFLNGDSPVFNSFYLQQARGFRKDIALLWNPINFNNIYDKEKEKLLKKKIPKENIDFEVIESLSKEREVFAIEKRGYKKKVNSGIISFQWIPYGLVFKISRGKDLNISKENYLEQQEKIISNYRLSKNDFENEAFYRSLTLNEIPSFYARSFYQIANFLSIYYKDPGSSKKFCERTIDIKNDLGVGYECLGNYYYSQNECVKAEKNFKKTIELDSNSKSSYIYLYLNYKNCFKDKEKEKSILKIYKTKFKDNDIQNFRDLGTSISY